MPKKIIAITSFLNEHQNISKDSEITFDRNRRITIKQPSAFENKDNQTVPFFEYLIYKKDRQWQLKEYWTLQNKKDYPIEIWKGEDLAINEKSITNASSLIVMRKIETSSFTRTQLLCSETKNPNNTYNIRQATPPTKIHNPLETGPHYAFNRTNTTTQKIRANP